MQRDEYWAPLFGRDHRWMNARDCGVSRCVHCVRVLVQGAGFRVQGTGVGGMHSRPGVLLPEVRLPASAGGDLRQNMATRATRKSANFGAGTP